MSAPRCHAMRTRTEKVQADVVIRHVSSKSGGAFEFEFRGLPDASITRLGCKSFMKGGVVRLVGEAISVAEVYKQRVGLIDALRNLEYAWARVSVGSRLGDEDILQVLEAGNACLHALAGSQPGNAPRSTATSAKYDLQQMLRDLFTEVVRGATGRIPLLVIQDKPASDVPWQALPLVNQEFGADFDTTQPFGRFLGRHFVIERRSKDHACSTNPIIDNRGIPLRMKFFQDRSLRACSKEADFFLENAKSNQIDLQGTPWPCNVRGTSQEWVSLANDHRSVILDGVISQGEVDHVHHYSCHHEFNAQSKLHFQCEAKSGGVKVALQQLKAASGSSQGCLLAFLNACETGLDADADSELDGLRGWMLRRLKFAAVIASETRTKDSSCGELSISFYRYFFGGLDTGHALHSAIRKAAEEGDPTCLLFALHGKGSVRVRERIELA